MEPKTDTPEYLAFTNNFSLLFGIKSGIRSVARKAFADHLIPSDLKDKCTGETSASESQTEELLKALQKRLESKPETLQKFAKILQGITGLDYIGTDLIDEEKRLQEQKRQQRLTTPISESHQVSSKSHTPFRHASHQKRSKRCFNFGTDRSNCTGTGERSVVGPSALDTPPPTPSPFFPDNRATELRQLDTNTPVAKRSRTKASSRPTVGKENGHLDRERDGSDDTSDGSVLSESPEKSKIPVKGTLARKRKGSTSSDKSSDYATPCASPSENKQLKGNKKRCRDCRKLQRLQSDFRKFKHEKRTQLRKKDNKITLLKMKLKTTQSKLRIVKKALRALQPDTDSSISPSVSPNTSLAH